MKVGDLVRCKQGWVGDKLSFGIVGIIVDTSEHTETYRSAGCKRLVILTAKGTTLNVWPGNLEVLNESR